MGKAVKKEGENIIFTVSADGFLYNMVRIMAGTLIEAGRGRISPDRVKDLLENPKRENAGATVPPYGLYLNKILKGAGENEEQ